MTTLNFQAGSFCQVIINQASSNDVAADPQRNLATNTSLPLTPTRNTSTANALRNEHRYHPYVQNRESVTNLNMETGVDRRQIEVSASNASTLSSTSENNIHQHLANQSEIINYSAPADPSVSQTAPQNFNDNVQLVMGPVSDVASPTSPLVVDVLPGRQTNQLLNVANPEGERRSRSQDNVLHRPRNNLNTSNRPQNQVSATHRVNREASQRDQEWQDFATYPCANPSQPSFQSLESRIATFLNWTASRTKPRPEVLAEAGFFFLGDHNRVKCFYCNGGLQNWRRNDDPWEEHAKWYPTCEFLLQQKGPEFIHGIVACLPHIDRPILRQMESSRPVEVTASAFPSSTQPPSPSLSNHIQNLNDAMQSEIAQTVIGLGFGFQLVREVMDANMQNNRRTFQSATELLYAVQEADSATIVDDDPEENSQSELGTSGQMMVTASVFVTAIDPPHNMGNQLEEISGISSETELEPNNNASTSSLQTLPSQRELLDQLRHDRMCKICRTHEADIVFIPCGHMCCCLSCSSALKLCLMCKAKIDKKIQTRDPNSCCKQR